MDDSLVKLKVTFPLVNQPHNVHSIPCRSWKNKGIEDIYWKQKEGNLTIIIQLWEKSTPFIYFYLQDWMKWIYILYISKSVMPYQLGWIKLWVIILYILHIFTILAKYIGLNRESEIKVDFDGLKDYSRF